MSASRELLAYCGLYCGDCLGYTGAIAEAAGAFQAVLERYQFGRTADHIFPEQLSDYDKLTEMIAFMTELRCKGVCREGVRDGVPLGCSVRACCVEKGLDGCYTCGEFEGCDTLATVLHHGLHLEACLKNLRGLRALGPERWLRQGARHCYWEEV